MCFGPDGRIRDFSRLVDAFLRFIARDLALYAKYAFGLKPISYPPIRRTRPATSPFRREKLFGSRDHTSA